MKVFLIELNLKSNINLTMGVIDLLFNHRKDILERNLTDGRIFMAENAEREGVVTLDSGLQYRVIKEGGGRKPKATDSVKCHYHGTNIKGRSEEHTSELQ